MGAVVVSPKADNDRQYFFEVVSDELLNSLEQIIIDKIKSGKAIYQNNSSLGKLTSIKLKPEPMALVEINDAVNIWANSLELELETDVLTHLQEQISKPTSYKFIELLDSVVDAILKEEEKENGDYPKAPTLPILQIFERDDDLKNIDTISNFSKVISSPEVLNKIIRNAMTNDSDSYRYLREANSIRVKSDNTPYFDISHFVHILIENTFTEKELAQFQKDKGMIISELKKTDHTKLECIKDAIIDISKALVKALKKANKRDEKLLKN